MNPGDENIFEDVPEDFKDTEEGFRQAIAARNEARRQRGIVAKRVRFSPPFVSFGADRRNSRASARRHKNY